MNLKIISLLFFILIFQTPLAIGVVNPGFETGDLTGWSKTGNVDVGTDYAYSGSYGARIYTPGVPASYLQQQLTLGDTVSFDIKIVELDTEVLIQWQGTNPTGNFNLATYSTTSGWNRKYIDTSAYNGYYGFLKFRTYSYNPGNDFYIDDVSTTMSEPGTLSGWIDNNLGYDVSSATVTLNNSGGETTTNDTGYYLISDIITDTYLISVTSPSYNDYNDTVVISGDVIKNITLTYKTPELTSLSILDAGDNSLLLGWRESLGADGVYVYVDSQTNLVEIVETPYTNIKMYDLTNLEPGTSYNIWCKPYKDTMQGSMYYVSGTTTGGGGGGGGGGAVEVLPPYEDIQPEIPEYPEVYDITNITSSDFITLAATNPEVIYEALSNITIRSPLPDKPGDNLLYFYLLIISVCSTLFSSKKEGWEVVTIISFVVVVISLIKLGWI